MNIFFGSGIALPMVLASHSPCLCVASSLSASLLELPCGMDSTVGIPTAHWWTPGAVNMPSRIPAGVGRPRDGMPGPCALTLPAEATLLLLLSTLSLSLPYLAWSVQGPEGPCGAGESNLGSIDKARVPAPWAVSLPLCPCLMGVKRSLVMCTQRIIRNQISSALSAFLISPCVFPASLSFLCSSERLFWIC